MKRIAIIGASGSVGRNALAVAEHLNDSIDVFALAVNSAVESLAEQVERFRPSVVGIAVSDQVDVFVRRCRERHLAVPDVLSGPDGIAQLAALPEVDTVVSAAVGAAGLGPTYAAVRSGKTVALANKETMVAAGELIRNAASQSGARIIPVDSEHSAIHQCLLAGHSSEVRRLILTASGGPFRELPAEKFRAITPEAALNHPVWKMGRRITIDSATLMNKGLEVIEARWLFNLPAASIDILIHPQSIVHSMVEFVDGSIIAQLGTADMRQPIQYALTYPKRLTGQAPALDWSAIRSLEFAPPDRKRFPSVGLAYDALQTGGTAPAVLNAADEIAVAAFLERRIAFSDISRIIASTLDAHSPVAADSLETVKEADRWAREFAEEMLH